MTSEHSTILHSLQSELALGLCLLSSMEEIQMVSLEMEWTQNWFQFKEECWRQRLEDLDDGERESGL